MANSIDRLYNHGMCRKTQRPLLHRTTLYARARAHTHNTTQESYHIIHPQANLPRMCDQW